MKTDFYYELRQFVEDSGFGNDIEWSESVKEPENAYIFFCEAAWVVINAGMRNQVAKKIWEKIQFAIKSGDPVCTVFKHKEKSKAIEYLWHHRNILFQDYLKMQTDNQKIKFFENLPWIGPITKYHLAKNLGIDVCKPDRHLVRIALMYGMSPEYLCKMLSKATGDRVATVDYVLWRSANLGKI